MLIVLAVLVGAILLLVVALFALSPGKSRVSEKIRVDINGLPQGRACPPTS